MAKGLWPTVVGVLLGGAGLLGYPAVGADTPSAAVTPIGRVLDTRREAFVEIEDGRTLAQVDSRLHRQGGRVDLLVSVDARGPDVSPAPGLEGVPGCNAMTALEIDTLLAEDAIRASVVLASGERRHGVVRAYEAVRLPARRLRSDGRIDYHARTKPRVAAFAIEIRDLPSGAHRLEVMARGEVRLTGTFQVGEDGAGSLGGFAATGGLHRASVGR